MKNSFPNILRYSIILIMITCLQPGCEDTGRSLVYQPPPGIVMDIDSSRSSLLVEVNSGKRLSRGIFTQSGESLVVFFHGNACTINAMTDYAKALQQRGYSILLVEYPGYGISSEYSPAEERIYSDANTLVSYIQKKYHFDKRHTVLFGQSLGTGVAMELAARGTGGKLVLVSPFSSLAAVAKHHYPDFLVSMVLSEKYDNISKADKVTNPVLIIHGKKDRVVPYRMGEALTGKLKNARMFSIHGAGHNDIYYYFDSKLWNEIDVFIKE